MLMYTNKDKPSLLHVVGHIHKQKFEGQLHWFHTLRSPYKNLAWQFLLCMGTKLVLVIKSFQCTQQIPDCR